MDCLSNLPSELQSMIIAMLSVEDVVRLSQTSKHFECHIDAWDSEYFDKNSCTWPNKMPIRNHKDITEKYLHRWGVAFIKDIVSLAPPNMSRQASELVTDVELILETFEMNELRFHYEEALRRAEVLILYDTADSLSNAAIHRLARKRRERWTSEPLWQYFLRVRLDKLWQEMYPSDFMRRSDDGKDRARVRMLAEILVCERRSTYEVIPQGLTGRAFFLHRTRRLCTRCSSRTSVQGSFHYRYCLSCIQHLKDLQNKDLMLNMVGIWHCFGDGVGPGAKEEDSEGNCLYSLQAYEAAVVQDHNQSIQNPIENTEVLAKLKDIFQGCYVNENIPKGLFDLLTSHHKCRHILHRGASAAHSQLDIATDYVLSACTRLSSLVDRYRVHHDRPDADVLACEAVALYVKYGAITTPDTRRNHNASKRKKHDSYRLSFCFAWDCLVTQKRMSDDVELQHGSEQFSMSDAREDSIEHRRQDDQAEHEQAT